ncbi:MAG TPA: ABC-2 transporter permease [Spirochaetota bacterium]|nr:ABC-2 transporter permease [Spirochaetota bacterium]
MKLDGSLIIMKKELRSYFYSPVAYIVIAAFLVLSGYLFFDTFFLFGRSELRGFFELLPITFSIFIPALTMRLFAEEKHSGSFEILMTLPVTTLEAVLGKFLGATAFVGIMLAPTLFYAISVALVGSPDIGPIVGGYLGALLLGATFAAIGIFASTLTKNQIIALIVGVLACFLLTLFGLDRFKMLMPSALVGVVEYLSVSGHFHSIERGVVDSRDIVYFLSVIALALMGSVHVLDERR